MGTEQGIGLSEVAKRSLLLDSVVSAFQIASAWKMAVMFVYPKSSRNIIRASQISQLGDFRGFIPLSLPFHTSDTHFEVSKPQIALASILDRELLRQHRGDCDKISRLSVVF